MTLSLVFLAATRLRYWLVAPVDNIARMANVCRSGTYRQSPSEPFGDQADVGDGD
ncbi:MAG TPA: hypothetical protein PLS67_02855 [Accumulibacter sp.]|jgi:hypothetical protein|nr:hypothetical protein [Accumulibacter sp.]HQC79448.1 hypothetical protein [Accumulibacter sp.]